MSLKPIVIILHGNWHTPAHYTTLLSTLNQTGLETICPELPSSNNSIPPTAGLLEDTQFIRSLITEHVNQSRAVILLMHSYGGVVGTNAVQGLLHHERLAQGLQGGVVHMIYLAAFVIPAQTAMATPFGGNPPPWIDEDVEKGIVEMQNWRHAFYNDCTDEEVEKLPPRVVCPNRLMREPIGNTPYEYIGKGLDATYIVCRKDEALKAEVQEGMAQLLGENRRMEYCDAGHCAMIKGYQQISDLVKAAWAVTQARLDS